MMNSDDEKNSVSQNHFESLNRFSMPTQISQNSSSAMF